MAEDADLKTEIVRMEELEGGMRVVCDKRINSRVKGKVYKIERPAIDVVPDET